MNFQNLPTDVRSIIYRMVPVRDLFWWQFTCKEWIESIWSSLESFSYPENCPDASTRPALAKMQNLSSLTIKMGKKEIESNSHDGILFFVNSVQTMPRLTSLDIHLSRQHSQLLSVVETFTDPSRPEMAERLQNLQKLALRFDWGIDIIPDVYNMLFKLIDACPNLQELRMVDFDISTYKSGVYGSQFFKRFGKLKHLHTLEVSPMYHDSDWKPLKPSVKHLVGITVLSANALKVIVSKNLAFLDLRSNDMRPLIAKALEGRRRDNAVANCVSLLDQYHQNQVTLSDNDVFSILDRALRAYPLRETLSIVLHPLILSRLQANPRIFHDSSSLYQNFFSRCESENWEEIFRKLLQSILLHTDSFAGLPPQHQLMLQRMVEFHYRINFGHEYISSHQNAALAARAMKQIILDLFPSMLYECRAMFPILLAHESIVSHQVYTSSSPSERLALLSFSDPFTALEYVSLARKLKDCVSNELIRPIIIQAIAHYNTGAFQDRYTEDSNANQHFLAACTPFSHALKNCDVESLQLLLELGYAVIPRLDVRDRDLSAAVFYCRSLQTMDILSKILQNIDMQHIKTGFGLTCPADLLLAENRRIYRRAFEIGIPATVSCVRDFICRQDDEELFSTLLSNMKRNGVLKRTWLENAFQESLYYGCEKCFRLFAEYGIDLKSALQSEFISTRWEPYLLKMRLKALVNAGLDVPPQPWPTNSIWHALNYVDQVPNN